MTYKEIVKEMGNKNREIDLSGMNLKELEDLKQKIEEEIKKRFAEDKQVKIYFETETDPRKHGKPYVARLSIKDGKLQRDFINNFTHSWGNNSITVSGYFFATVGDIYEIRWGGSWKNEYRSWYICKEDGLYEVADAMRGKGKKEVMRYLQGEKIEFKLGNSPDVKTVDQN